ncbi:hypothetical protein HHL17_19940 [Chitinophaga sp. G-6-1-13]|uniref:Uncharacterized protein n=1 Tax=Chitinophaga fulva TaxID=2728842 RepID=A0A848GRX9_9BACT|nr:hypothetical protein [Chitinophaga fulva]NML39483.1 hypothetical protein [Chitinophaga fulva]
MNWLPTNRYTLLSNLSSEEVLSALQTNFATYDPKFYWYTYGVLNPDLRFTGEVNGNTFVISRLSQKLSKREFVKIKGTVSKSLYQTAIDVQVSIMPEQTMVFTIFTLLLGAGVAGVLSWTLFEWITTGDIHLGKLIYALVLLIVCVVIFGRFSYEDDLARKFIKRISQAQ